MRTTLRLTTGLLSAIAFTLTACGSDPVGTGSAQLSGTGSATTTAFFSGRDVVINPAALFDPAQRSEEARVFHHGRNEPSGHRSCPRPTDVVDFRALLEPSITVQANGPIGTNTPRDFARALNGHAFRLLLTQDADEAARAVRALRAHADHNAWIPQRASWSSASSAVVGLVQLLPAWHILRQTGATTDEDRRAIDDWLRRVADSTDIHPGENSIGTMRGANHMLLGLMLGEKSRYDRGVRTGYIAQLRAMRPDGSFPMEADRGVAALDHTGRNIGLMIYSATIARSAGQDLFATKVDGKSLDDAIRFLLRAADDNRVIDAYARKNRDPANDHPVFRPNAQISPFGNPARGWILLYAKRFPNDDLTQELVERVTLGHRFAHDLTGGYVTCYAARF